MKTCHDCGVKEGQLHQLGCDMERCPVCGNQAICCYKHCCNKNGTWKKSFLNSKRIPYIIIPVCCRKCLMPYPDFFVVPDNEWKKVVPPNLRNDVLCKDCYNKIKEWTGDDNGVA